MKKNRNPLAKDLRTQKYKLKIEPNKKKYTRKNQPKPESATPEKNWLNSLKLLYYICVTVMWHKKYLNGELKMKNLLILIAEYLQ